MVCTMVRLSEKSAGPGPSALIVLNDHVAWLALTAVKKP